MLVPVDLSTIASTQSRIARYDKRTRIDGKDEIERE